MEAKREKTAKTITTVLTQVVKISHDPAPFIFTFLCFFFWSRFCAMAKQTGHLLRKLRSLMKSKHQLSEAVEAYIIPSGDAHQVNYF